MIVQILLCSLMNGGENHLFENSRAIGGESLDTSKFVLYFDSNSSRFVEVPGEYMRNWIDDHQMWRTWSIVLSVTCFIFLCALLCLLFYGFTTATGPFHYWLKRNDVKTPAAILPTDHSPITNTRTSQHAFLVSSRYTPSL